MIGREGSVSHSYFEDYEVGHRTITRGRTVTRGDLSVFAGLTGDFYPLHTDEDFASRTEFGGVIAHGPLTLSLAVGLVVVSNYFGDSVLAFLGLDNVRATAPVFPGDTIHVEVGVVETRASKQPNRGVVRLHYAVLNQRQETVMELDLAVLTRRQPTARGQRIT
ncbi:MAG: MaoC/PaaZ C-terminal domain-containing protein [Chloroflexota bacterium]